MEPLKIYTVIPHVHTASFYYRLEVPLETARDLGLPVIALVDRHDNELNEEQRTRAFCEADIVMLYQPVGEGPINNIRGLQSFIPSKVEGNWKWAPSIIIENDDNLFNVSPLNPAFKNLGFRDLEGNEIPPGHQIGMTQNGENHVLWRDGANGFDINRNRRLIDSWKQLLGMADLVSCSTNNVAESVKREVSPRRIKVFPNLVRMDHYEQVDLRPEPYKVKILWQGGAAHYEDWQPLREALGNITKKYPQVHWIIWGAQYPWVKELIPSNRYTFKDWCAYQEYKLRLVTIGHDISLAPLSSNVFNDCRSAIKFYEASVLKRPAATLAQNTGPYKDEIIDGQTALLFSNPKEFEEKLSLLIEDRTERQRLAANAKDWVSENRDAFKKVPEMVAYWEQIREERKREQPHVSDEQWQEIETAMKTEHEEMMKREQEGTDASVHPEHSPVG